MSEYLEIGQIVNTNGLKGMLKVRPLTDDLTRFDDLETVYIDMHKELIEFKVQEVRYSKNMVLLKLEGIDDIDEAEKFRNLYIKINREDAVDLDENSYFIVDIIGSQVYTEKDELLGKITEVLELKSNDVYVVKNAEGKEILLPAIEDVIKNIDIENKKVIIHLMDGLIWK